MGRPGRGRNPNPGRKGDRRLGAERAPARPLRSAVPPKPASTRWSTTEVVDVVVAFLGSVLAGTEVVLDELADACAVVVVVAPFLVVFGLMGGTVVVVVLPVVAPGVVAPITCCAWLIAACIASMSDWNCVRLSAFSAASALV